MPKFEVLFSFDPFKMAGTDRPETKRATKEALKEIAEYVKAEMLQHYGDGVSPAAGGKWTKKLSPEYAELKKEISGVNFSNMELYGDLLDSLEARIDGDKITVGWSKSNDQAPKAFGHQTGYKGHPTIEDGPVRQLVPEKGQTFKRDIVKGMREIAEEFMPEE